LGIIKFCLARRNQSVEQVNGKNTTRLSPQVDSHLNEGGCAGPLTGGTRDAYPTVWQIRKPSRQPVRPIGSIATTEFCHDKHRRAYAFSNKYGMAKLKIVPPAIIKG
jgi:hypothetical protein